MEDFIPIIQEFSRIYSAKMKALQPNERWIDTAGWKAREILDWAMCLKDLKKSWSKQKIFEFLEDMMKRAQYFNINNFPEGASLQFNELVGVGIYFAKKNV